MIKHLRQSDIDTLRAVRALQRLGDLMAQRRENIQAEDITVQHSHACQHMYSLPLGSWMLYRGCLIQRTAEGFRCEDPRQMCPVLAREGMMMMGRMHDKIFSLPALVVAWIDARMEEAA